MDRQRYPGMVRWFSPRQLWLTASEVAASMVVTRIIDPRTAERAGPAPEPLLDWEDRQEVWFDFVADTGDGWNPTFRVACAVAQAALELKDPAQVVHPTRRGDILLFGGDLVYPTPRDDAYAVRLLGPYEEALPKAAGGDPTLLAIPGNHDWYDGLRAFRQRFSHPFNRFAAWVTRQTGSYFAAALPGGWWLLGVDVQLGGRLDEPQLRFFREVAGKLREGDRLILAMPEPDWLELPCSRQETTDMPSDQIEKIMERDVDVCLSGNLHHYRRHETIPCDKHPKPRQRITCGGGGAFLHATHLPLARVLRNSLKLRASFPPPRDSLAYRKRLLAFPFLNPSFGLVPALLYGLFAMSMVPAEPSSGFGTFLSQLWRELKAFPFSAGAAVPFFVVGYAFRERGSPASSVLAALHVGVQLLAAVGALYLSVEILKELTGSASEAAIVAVTSAIGFIAGSFVMGGYLYVSSLFGKLLDRSYAALRIQDWKSFLRIRVRADGRLTIFPVGLRRVPRSWRRVPEDGERPTLRPEDAVTEPELIEVPIEISRS